MRKLLAIPFVAAASVVLAAGPALATATFDPATGTGYVGKGDVQVPFGWNNTMLQSNAEKVSFTYVDSTEYDVTCKETVDVTEVNKQGKEQKKKVHTFAVSDAVAAVTYDATKRTKLNPKGAVTGFHITGKNETIPADPPAEGDVCQIEELGENGVAGKVTLVEQTATTGDTLTASHAALGKSAVVWTDGVSTLP